MKIKIAGVFILSLICLQSFAQKKYNGYFFKNSGEEVMIRDSADYVRIISEPDSGSSLYNVSEFYKDGKPKLVGKTSKLDYLRLEGQAIEYYPSGKKRKIANYNNGKEEGESYSFYPNGKLYIHKKYLVPGTLRGSDYGAQFLIMDRGDSTGKATVINGNGYYVSYDDDFKEVYEEGAIKEGLKDGNWKGKSSYKDKFTLFTEQYANGKLLSGNAVDEKNVSYSYTQRETPPTYKNGFEQFYRFISNRVVYPAAARKNNIQGTVRLSFVVERDGSLTDIKVKQSPDNDLSDEAVRVLKLSPKWVPGIQFGKPVRVQYMLPLNFAL